MKSEKVLIRGEELIDTLVEEMKTMQSHYALGLSEIREILAKHLNGRIVKKSDWRKQLDALKKEKYDIPFEQKKLCPKEHFPDSFVTLSGVKHFWCSICDQWYGDRQMKEQ